MPGVERRRRADLEVGSGTARPAPQSEGTIERPIDALRRSLELVTPGGHESLAIDAGILRRWRVGQFDEELIEDGVDPERLPWSDLGLGDVFGGRYIDVDGTMVVCTTKPLTSEVPRGVRVELVDRSMRDLLDLKALLTRDLVSGAPDNCFVGVGPDVVTNMVRVHVATSEAADALAERSPYRDLIEQGALHIDVTGQIFAS